MGHTEHHDADDATLSFDERAATWDSPENTARAQDIARRIAQAVSLNGTERLFEYGAGTGLVSEALRDSVGPITMADASAGMRAVAQEKVDDGRLVGARVWDIDLAGEPIPQGETFDLIVTSMVLHHVKRLDETLAAFVNMLSESGHVCVIDLDAEDGSFHGPDVDVHHGFSRKDIAARLSGAGLVDVAVSDCGVVERDGHDFGLFLAVGSR